MKSVCAGKYAIIHKDQTPILKVGSELDPSEWFIGYCVFTRLFFMIVE